MKLEQDRLVPYFQPIIAADTRKIYSYEALGRYIDDDGNVKSLGPFFNDDNIPNEKILEIDHIIRKKALKHFAENAFEELLFVNLKLAWMVRFSGQPEKSPLMNWVKEFGIDPNKIVIEITEEELQADPLISTTAIDHYKNFGFKIAIDDYGNRASDLDRLAMVSPDMIKLDMHYIHQSEKSNYYKEYLHSLTSFAQCVGIEVLYEGVENNNQFDICIEARGRFFQGFHIGVPQKSIFEMQINNKVIKSAFQRPIIILQNNAKRLSLLQSNLDENVNKFLDRRKDFSNIEINSFVTGLCMHLPDYVVRACICNKYGRQISCNFEKHAKGSNMLDYRDKNWIWSRYFQEAANAFAAGRKSYISDVYRDVTSKKELHTYVFFLNEKNFIFLDFDPQRVPFAT